MSSAKHDPTPAAPAALPFGEPIPDLLALWRERNRLLKLGEDAEEAGQIERHQALDEAWNQLDEFIIAQPARDGRDLLGKIAFIRAWIYRVEEQIDEAALDLCTNVERLCVPRLAKLDAVEQQLADYTAGLITIREFAARVDAIVTAEAGEPA